MQEFARFSTTLEDRLRLRERFYGAARTVLARLSA